MADNAYTLALKDTLDGMARSFPLIRNALFFDETGNIIAMNENTSEEAAVRTVDALDKILNEASLLGEIENAVFEGAKGWFSVSRFGNLFLMTTGSTKTDLDRANVLSSALVPTVLKVLTRVNVTPEKENLVIPEQPIMDDLKEEPEELVNEKRFEKHSEEHVQKKVTKPALPEPQVNQFIVENIGGLFASSEIVRIDESLLSKWKDMYEDREIAEVEIETFGGKSVRCKVKSIKDAKFEGKGLVQIHEKVQTTLMIRKGELVRVKPVIE